MINDGLYDKIDKPDVVLGGHVMPYRAGYIGTRRGPLMASADSFQ
jgi:metal-dependent amidase/aminoacylase/carboxypeptidase family protein